jgi:hypothetical protein
LLPGAMEGMSDSHSIHPFPSHESVLQDLANQLLECGAVLSQIVSGMVQWQAAGLSHPNAVPIPEAARTLVADVLKEAKPKHSRRDLKVAAAIVKEATDAIAENVYFVDPDWAREVLDNANEEDGAA